MFAISRVKSSGRSRTSRPQGPNSSKEAFLATRQDSSQPIGFHLPFSEKGKTTRSPESQKTYTP